MIQGSLNIQRPAPSPPPLPAREASLRAPPPPPLPPRNNRPPPPALPPRNTSDTSTNRTSTDSSASIASISTNSTGTSLSSVSSSKPIQKTPLRAPAWGGTNPPQLPPRRDATKDVQSPSSQRRGRRWDASVVQVPPMPLEPAPASASAPKLPPRTNSRTPVKEKPPVPLPARSSTSDITSSAQRKLPPPPPRPDVLRKIQGSPLGSLNTIRGERQPGEDKQQSKPVSNGIQGHGPPTRPAVPEKTQSQQSSDPLTRPHPKPQLLSLESLSKVHQERRRHEQSKIQDDDTSIDSLAKDLRQQCQLGRQSPPPVPLDTRPDLSKLQVAKPRFSSPAASGPICLKCRDFSAPDAHAARFPRRSLPSHDLEWLAMQLTSPFPSATDKARAIFTWLHHNIEYDTAGFFNNSIGPQTPESTLASGLAVCDGFAGLFEKLATHAGLQARKISGHGAGYGFRKLQPGDPIPPFCTNHAWNVVQIEDGYWKLIDACWGAGAVDGPNRPYMKRFEPDHFTMSNDEFGLRHYPSDPTQFYRDDGRPSISWEEYLLNASVRPGLANSGCVTVFGGVKEEHGVGEATFMPRMKNVSVSQPGPLRFEFRLVCPDWTLPRNSGKSAPYLFVLMVHGVDGRRDELVPFTYVPGSNPGGGGDMWYLDIADPRTLGTPGQQLMLHALTSFGDRRGEQARGLTVQEFRAKYGRCGLALKGVAEWMLV
ncbi:hypothetical protein VTO42DRAFT_3146 [Malbranchea cinnamomea]